MTISSNNQINHISNLVRSQILVYLTLFCLFMDDVSAIGSGSSKEQDNLILYKNRATPYPHSGPSE